MYEYFDIRNIRSVSLILKTLELSRRLGGPCTKETVNLAEDLLPRIALKFSKFLLIS
jgi:hypothetical protein